MKSRFFSFFMIVALAFIAVACERDDSDPQGDEMARLEAWMQVNNVIPTTKTSSGLYYIEHQTGTGIAPQDSSYLLYTYTAKTLDDIVFLTTDKSTANLNGLFSYTYHYAPEYQLYSRDIIRPSGLFEGLGLMKEGGKARLIIPSTIGLGNQAPSTGIPGYSTLIYDVELIKVVEDPEAYEKSNIDEYLANNSGFTLVSDTVYYKKISDGDPLSPAVTDSLVQVKYIGRFLDGFIFDTNILTVAKENNIYDSKNISNYEEPFLEFVIGDKSSTQVPLAGFQFAVRQMTEGEKAIFIIPSEFMYGSNGHISNSGLTIPPYEPLIFEIELVDVDEKIEK